jgi:hypothetical protein
MCIYVGRLEAKGAGAKHAPAADCQVWSQNMNTGAENFSSAGMLEPAGAHGWC